MNVPRGIYYYFLFIMMKNIELVILMIFIALQLPCLWLFVLLWSNYSFWIGLCIQLDHIHCHNGVPFIKTQHAKGK